MQFNTENFESLHYAVFNKEYDYVKWLLEHGADVNKKDERGHHPLDLCDIHSPQPSPGDDERIRASNMIKHLLLEYGAVESGNM